jgi:hypothetical protein
MGRDRGQEGNESAQRFPEFAMTKEGSAIAEFYVAPAGFVYERSRITDYEAAAYHGPYGTRDEAYRIADLVREQTSRARLSLRTQRRGIVLTVISGLAMTVGFIMTSATSSTYALCNGDIGHVGQAVRSITLTRCAADTTAHGLGFIILILGILGILGGVGTLLARSLRRL